MRLESGNLTKDTTYILPDDSGADGKYLKYNTGGSLSSNTYTIPMRNSDGMFLDATDDELYVVVRYKGDPAPIQSITLGYS